MDFSKGRRITIVASILLAAIPSMLVIWLLPFNQGKYLLECTESHIIPDNTYLYYDDLNGDGNSEKISAFDSPNSTGVTIYEEGRIIDQWNIRGAFGFMLKEVLFITMDYNCDGIREIYLFSLSNDTILLHSIDDFSSPELKQKNRFITRVGHGLKVPDPSMIRGEADDLDGDGKKELIFGINTGFSEYPRQVYAYYIDKDSLAASPESSGFILKILQADIDGDSIREIIPYGYAANNIPPEMAKYHDHSAWLMVLDENLKFQFEPVEFKGNYVQIKPVFNPERNAVLEVLASPQDKDSLSSIYGIDLKGEIEYRKKLNHSVYDLWLTKSEGLHNYIMYSKSDGLILQDLNGKSLYHDDITGFITQADVDFDGSDEILFSSAESSKFIIYRSGLKNPAVCEFDWRSTEEMISVIQSGGKLQKISLQSGGKEYLLQYGANPWYYLNYAMYAGVFFAFWGFVQLVRFLQSKSSEAKFAIERKITDLQLSLLRNQLDPHFTLNAINSVIFSVLNSEKEKAVIILRKFSALYRTIVLSAGNSRRTLGEEILFSTEYLNLEKIRLGENFNYDFEVSEKVDRNVHVPKMLIHFFAENAIKHAFKKPGISGMLNIRVFNVHKGISIIIEDNGIGRSRASEINQDSTHKGLEIMTELFRLYNKYYNEKIYFDIEDLLDCSNNASGTKVIISIT